MEICIAQVKGRPIMLKYEPPLVYIDGQIEHVKGLTEQDLLDFKHELDSVPVDDTPGYHARLNARRAAFLARLLGLAAAEESQDVIMRLLDHVHYDVLEFLGETDNNA